MLGISWGEFIIIAIIFIVSSKPEDIPKMIKDIKSIYISIISLFYKVKKEIIEEIDLPDKSEIEQVIQEIENDIDKTESPYILREDMVDFNNKNKKQNNE